MDLVNRLQKFKFSSEDAEEVKYLKSNEISGILSKGMAELANKRPNNPVTFLATWLLNESKSYEIKKALENQAILREQLLKKQADKNAVLEVEKKAKIKEEEKEINLRHNLVKYIETTTDMDDILNQVCNKLKEYTNSTGVYIGNYELNRLTVDEKASHEAHLGQEEVIRYTFFSDCHSFLKGQFIPLEKGVTYDLFKQEEEEPADDEEEEKKEKDIGTLIIEEVVREPRVHYFREPQLGAYLAVNLSYKTCLFPDCLESAIENYKAFTAAMKEYEEKVAEFTERKEAWENEVNPKKEEGEDSKDNTAKEIEQEVEEDEAKREEIEAKREEFNTEWEGIEAEKPVLQDHLVHTKKMVLCLDTIGQDRMFTGEELEYAKNIAKTVVKSSEALESKLLLKDRDIRMKIASQEAVYQEEVQF